LNVVNAPKPNASDSPSATKSQGSAQSIASSASTAQDFSSLLMDMVGAAPIISVSTVAIPQTAGLPNPLATDPAGSVSTNPVDPAAVPQNTGLPDPLTAAQAQALNVPDANAQNIQQACGPDQLNAQGSADSKKPQETKKTQDPSQPNQTLVLPFVPFVVAAQVTNQQGQINGTSETQQPEKAINSANSTAAPTQPPTVLPEIQRAWADVKKFEFTVQTASTSSAGTQAQPQGPQADAIMTTDPIANIQLQQLPPRITAIEKLMPELKSADRPKADAGRDSLDTSTTVPTLHFGDMTKSVEQIEQVRAAHIVEIPQMPHLQVVRTVSMEVGDADSQVTVRIQERSGDISLQINAANEPLHQDLQSSVGSLVQALKQDQVQVSNVDFSRKSPIDKVRRMKEAN
jgi:hypothetical protein